MSKTLAFISVVLAALICGVFYFNSQGTSPRDISIDDNPEQPQIKNFVTYLRANGLPMENRAGDQTGGKWMIAIGSDKWVEIQIWTIPSWATDEDVSHTLERIQFPLRFNKASRLIVYVVGVGNFGTAESAERLKLSEYAERLMDLFEHYERTG